MRYWYSLWGKSPGWGYAAGWTFGDTPEQAARHALKDAGHHFQRNRWRAPAELYLKKDEGEVAYYTFKVSPSHELTFARASENPMMRARENPRPPGPYGVRYADGSWLRWDGYATMPGSVRMAWSGSKEEARRIIRLGIPLDKAKPALLPVASANPGAAGFVHEHPWMTFFLGVLAISAVANIVVAVAAPKILPGSGGGAGA